MVAVAGIGWGVGLSLSAGPEVEGAAFMSGLLVTAGAGTAALSRAIPLPLNLASTLQHNAEIRASRRPSGGGADREPGLEDSIGGSGPAVMGNTRGTLRRFRLGMGAGNVDGSRRSAPIGTPPQPSRDAGCR